jgi:hypothetical protein
MGFLMSNLFECRICGNIPEMAFMEEAEMESHAIYCKTETCYNDTHWQNSMTKAEEIWEANPVPHDVRGGQGDASDDHIN